MLEMKLHWTDSVVCGALLLAACARPAPPTPLAKEPIPVPGLTREQQQRFEAGRAVFKRVFSRDTGLGPFFNSTSCAECHEAPTVGGRGASEQGSDEVQTHATRFTPPASCDTLTAAGGPVFRRHAVQGDPPAIPADAQIGQRTTPMLFGFGLIEAIPDATILANERKSGGRAHRSSDGRVARFGRKAAVATLGEFAIRAFSVEQGIEIPVELSATDADLTTNFVQFLAPPQPKDPDKKAKRGAEVFERIGCAQCHTPKMETGENPVRALHRKPVFLYSDLLLHDMGPALADTCIGQARPSEFRTEPLMGLRFRDRFLHDGRALTLESAILQHGGQGQKAADAFFRLSDAEREALLLFLRSL